MQPGSQAVLEALRSFLATAGLAALVVPSEGETPALLQAAYCFAWDVNARSVLPCSTDAHQSEYTPLKDRRREFVSGFTGSAGTGMWQA
jgi:hypothetical protein